MPTGLIGLSLQPDLERMMALLRLGGPAALQNMLEVGVFAAVAVLAAKISPIALAANQIVLNIAGFCFMVPFGLSSAAAVRVGHAVGRGDRAGAKRSGWCAVMLALLGSVVTAGFLVATREPLLRLFSRDDSVVAVGATLLLLCAVFQPFDGCQAVATGALRGIGETRTPMLCNLAGHWFIGLPLAFVLCFRQGWGVIGLWTGLSVSLALIGAVLVGVWHRRASRHVRPSRSNVPASAPRVKRRFVQRPTGAESPSSAWAVTSSSTPGRTSCPNSEQSWGIGPFRT